MVDFCQRATQTICLRFSALRRVDYGTLTGWPPSGVRRNLPPPAFNPYISPRACLQILRILRKNLPTDRLSRACVALFWCTIFAADTLLHPSYNRHAVSCTLKLVLAVAGLSFVVLVVYWSLHLGQVKVEVCLEFRGRSNCGTAAAPNEEEAIRTATDNACATIASGMTDSIACSRTPPTSVRRLHD